MKLNRALTALLCAAVLMQAAPGAAAVDSVVAAAKVEQMAPGVSLTSFDRLYPFGWVKGYLLDADLTASGVSADLITAGPVTAARPLSAMAQQTGAIAAVNGDFFDINNTKAPLGPVLRSGVMVKSAPAEMNAAGVGADRLGRLTSVLLDGQVATPYGAYKLASLNQWTVPGGGIGLYTPDWTVPRKGAAYGAATACEAVLKDGKVVSVAKAAGTAPAAPGTLVLVGREAGAEALCRLKAGDPVSVTYGPAPALRFAVGGGDVLVKAGQVQNVDNKGYKPRSAIGFSADGKRMLLLTVDGRSEESGGLTLLQLANLMRELGAADALELDGGGSAQMVARGQVVNRPSDGVERPVPDAVGIFVPAGSGKPVGLTVRPVSGSDRVFPGLTRRLEAVAFDEQYSSVPLPPVSWVGAEGGVFRAAAAASERVEARAGTVTGTVGLRVLGPLTRIEFEPPSLELTPGESTTVRVIGYDAEGYSAPIEPGDLTLSYQSSALDVDAGSLRLRMARDGQAVVVAQVQGKSASLPVAAGGRAVAVTGFENPAAWAFDGYPAVSVTGSAAGAPGRTRNGLKLTYSFGNGAATRAAYARGSLVLPGRPAALGLWVNGDGKGAWLRAEVAGSDGARKTLDLALKVDWTGWRYVEAAIPSDLTPPIRVERFYPVETNRERIYSGSLTFDDLLVKWPYALPEVAPSPVVPDPILTAAPPADGWRFALVTAAGATKEQVLDAAKSADLVVLGGTALGAPGLSGLSREAQVPVYGLAGGIRFDWKGVRFLGIDTASGSLRSPNFSQLTDLRTQLDAAAADPAVKALVLVTAAPPARFSDWREASMISRWLAEFRDRSGGKPVTYVAGGARSLVTRYDGVAYLELAGGGGTVTIAKDPSPGNWFFASPWR
ncbi:MAG TPA: phosphodiester glycosidase family protein [Symbiobacteriaceae bacterium]|nr:phosphodiester glycosidase family protein [Symbiobacteriaceae bacterium]